MNKLVTTSVRVAALLAMTTGVAFADTGSAASWGPVGAGLAVGLAALGGSMGQGRTAASGLEGMARNPQAAGSLLTPMVLGLAFTESLVLFGFVIAYLAVSK